MLFPGATIGAVVASVLARRFQRPVVRAVGVAAGVGVALVFSRALVPAWPVRLLLGAVAHSAPPAGGIDVSVAVEVALGPVLACLVTAARWAQSHTFTAQLERVARETGRRHRAIARSRARRPRRRGHSTHPLGKLRLGWDVIHACWVDIALSELRQHVFAPGASGSGKTTTLLRLADGALVTGASVVIVDCKGSSLRSGAHALARRHGATFVAVDPDDDHSAGYDATTGDAAAVANKLVGAFAFSGEAEIYKHVAMQVLPVVVRALAASFAGVSLDTITDSLGKGGLARLGRASGHEALRRELSALEDMDGLGAAGLAGLRYRLGALREGRFGAILRRRPAVDWQAVAATPAVAYFALSATAASEDVELLARVIAQDLKQLADRRMRSGERHRRPLMVIFDEFAALREADQLVDLLLQAREAAMPVVVGTQFLPLDHRIRTPLLQSGVLLVHRLSSSDAQLVAAEFGTRLVPFATSQLDYASGHAGLGSVRLVDEFRLHPNVLRTLPTGVAATYLRGSDRQALVAVEPAAP